VVVVSPTPSPTPTADPACNVGLCEPPTTNTAPPVRVFLRLYQLFDAAGNWVQPTPDPVKQVVVEPMPVGYTVRIDIQGRDVEDKPTNGKGDVQIIVSDPLMVDVQISSHYQRKIKILKAGKWEMYTTLDGVASNSLGFTFCDPATSATCKYP
jgi:hypothetical protein